LVEPNEYFIQNYILKIFFILFFYINLTNKVLNNLHFGFLLSKGNDFL